MRETWQGILAQSRRQAGIAQGQEAVGKIIAQRAGLARQGTGDGIQFAPHLTAPLGQRLAPGVEFRLMGIEAIAARPGVFQLRRDLSQAVRQGLAVLDQRR